MLRFRSSGYVSFQDVWGNYLQISVSSSDTKKCNYHKILVVRGEIVAWDDIPESAVEIANSLLQTLKQKDPFTFYHCCRVGRASRRLAKAMDLNVYEQAILEYSGLFHDLGKISVPDEILLKPARLTKEEYEIMKSHPIKSVEILQPLEHIPFFRFLQPGVKYHHEKYDGTGYPYGLAGEKIPLTARIIAVVDTVDAMMNTRPYREGLPWDVVKQELVDFSGRQFDPSIVKVYLESVGTWADIEEQDQDEVVVAQVLREAA